MAFAYKKKLTLSNTYVDSLLSDVPILVDIIADEDIGAVARSDGYDVQFFEDEDLTTPLYFERIAFGISDGAADGSFWVKTDLLSASATEIWCAYGDAGETDQSNAASTFSGYTAVWHMDDASGYVQDATNNYDAIYVGGSPDYQQGGISGYSIGFDSASFDYFHMGDVLNFNQNQAYSVSFWRKAGDTIDSNIIGKQNSSYPWQGWLVGSSSAAARLESVIFSAATGARHVRWPSDYTDNAWHHLVTTYDGSSNANGFNLYNNGAAVSKTIVTNTNATSTSSSVPFQLSGRNGANSLTKGNLDEIRIASGVISPDVVKAQYYYEIDQSQITWGSEESVGGGAPNDNDAQAMMWGALV